MENFILTEVSRRYKNLSCCFFYGSHLKQHTHPASDIDVISVIQGEITSFREHFMAGNKVFDSFVFDAGSLHAAMKQSYSAGSFTLVHSILGAVPLPCPTPVSIRLQEIALELQQGANVNLDRALFMARHRLGSVINDLIYCDESDRIALSSAAYRVITEALLLHLGGGIQGVKHGGRYLRNKMQADYVRLQQALRDAISGDVQDLAKWAQVTLDNIGGPLGNHFRERLPQLTRIPLD